MGIICFPRDILILVRPKSNQQSVSSWKRQAIVRFYFGLDLAGLPNPLMHVSSLSSPTTTNPNPLGFTNQ